MPISLERVVERARTARAALPAFIAWLRVARQQRLFRLTGVAVRKQWAVVVDIRCDMREVCLRCWRALANKPQHRFTMRV